MVKRDKIIIATGGTGGHIFPARSLALELCGRGFQVTIFADKNYRKYHQTSDPYDYLIVPSAQVNNGKLFHLFLAALKIGLGVIFSFVKIGFNRPKIVVAFGGYSTFPTLLASLILRRKIILHEQNAHLGKVNRIFAKYALRIALSYEQTSGINQDYLPKTVLVGNPIRKEIIQLNKDEYRLPSLEQDAVAQKLTEANMGYDLLLASQFYNRKQDSNQEFINILVIGGSGGSKIFSEVLPRAFFNIRDDLKNNIRIIQQCRKEYLDSTFEQYKDFNLNIVIGSFFDNMADLIKKTHLVIARSGSSSIAEFTAAKRPMILVPFAQAADNHQEKNAEAIAKKGGAIIIKEDKFTINNVTGCLESLLDNPAVLIKMSKASSDSAFLAATENLTKLIIDLL